MVNSSDFSGSNEKVFTNDSTFEIARVMWITRESDNKVIIDVKTWKSGFHVRPSTVTIIEINKLKNKYNFNIFFNWQIIEEVIDILSLWLRENVEFKIILEWEKISDELVESITYLVNSLEEHPVGWIESVPNAINRILGHSI